MSVANSIKEEAKEETSKITAKMLEDARVSIEGQKRAALAEVKTLVAELSLDITEKILKKELADKKAQQGLVEDYIKDLNLN